MASYHHEWERVPGDPLDDATGDEAAHEQPDQQPLHEGRRRQIWNPSANGDEASSRSYQPEIPLISSSPRASAFRRSLTRPFSLHSNPDCLRGPQDEAAIPLTLDRDLDSEPSDLPAEYGSPNLRVNTQFYATRASAADSNGRQPDHPFAEVRMSPTEITPVVGHGEAGDGKHAHFDGAGAGAEEKDSQARASKTPSLFKTKKYRDWVEQQKKKTRGPRAKLKQALDNAYQRWIVEFVLRQYPLPPSKDGRHIAIDPVAARRKPLHDERRNGPHISNFIRSSRYTLWDFLPKQLLFQFSKLANFYFLCIAIMQMIPGLSTTGTYTTIGPLMAFVALSMAKEAYDDYRRYRLDKLENRAATWVLDPEKLLKRHQGGGRSRRGLFGKRQRPKQADNGAEIVMDELRGVAADSDEDSDAWALVSWQDLRVGDVVRLARDDNIPADIVLLHSTGPNGIAYIETMALDGETNLKSKQACPLLAKRCDTLPKLLACRAEVVAEDPNLDLYSFEGRVSVDGETMPLTMNEVVYRGSTLRNTEEALGLVINSGEECKIRMNANKNNHAKAPAMQSVVNGIIFILVIFVILLAVGCTVGNEAWNRDYLPHAWYLHGYSVPFKEIIVGFIIEFNTLIPLSLYVSLEIIKIGQLLLLQDIEMYDPETDTPMVANTTTILENLGQVSYVFSDKTGTLTENKMRFRKLTVAGTAWLHDMDVKQDEQEMQRRMTERSISLKGKSITKEHLKTSSTETAKFPLVEAEPRTSAVSRLSRSSSVWRSSVRPTHSQPELNTESLLQYIDQRPNTAFSKKARQFLLCIALCHTALPEAGDDGEIEYQASSPDELALVLAARDLGYLLVDRPTQSIILRFKNSHGEVVTEKYEVLDVIEFSSKRKRMSIIIRMPDGRICVFCKGADSIIMPRLKLASLAKQKSSVIERRASRRKTMEADLALRRQSGLFGSQASVGIARAATSMTRRQTGTHTHKGSLRRSSTADEEIQSWLTRRETEDFEGSTHDPDPTSPASPSSPQSVHHDDAYDGVIDEALASSDGAIFERCFQHIDDFASEGLRTLLYAYRYLDDHEYATWKKIYQEASTSLTKRQERIESAGEMIEKDFDLAGATAIEDKLQVGVPETIDKLRRAGIHVWMLTGDKRETAINIAHAARICKPFSEVFILDVGHGDLEDQITTTLEKVSDGHVPHSVVVVDGHTLAIIEDNESWKIMFFDLVVRTDSVICCRASPSQKATLVKCIRDTVPSSLTLAIGDGANDIAMIQASHVGIGISGREGLQAARISDYSIAQFRFLQRLLFVHGRWNYIRTAKYILGTFWKEIVFYIVQAQFQRWNGYTGTSLYEPASLAVFNTLFTSLPVILLGIFEKDLRASTLLAVPELYNYGQKNRGFNFAKYIGWTFMAATESVIIWMTIYGIYNNALFTSDTQLYAMGTMAFTVCVIFINIKMLVLELHHKTLISFTGFMISVTGWFLWCLFLAGIYKPQVGPYTVHFGMLHDFGHTLLWWVGILVTIGACVVWELLVTSIRRVYFPTDQDLWQEVEHDKAVMDVLKEHAAERGESFEILEEEDKGKANDRRPSAAGTERSNRFSGGSGGDGWTFDQGHTRTTNRRAHDDEYVPPPFTPPAEEIENPLEAALSGRGKQPVEVPTASEIEAQSASNPGGFNFELQMPLVMKKGRSPPVQKEEKSQEAPSPESA